MQEKVSWRADFLTHFPQLSHVYLTISHTYFVLWNEEIS